MENTPDIDANVQAAPEDQKAAEPKKLSVGIQFRHAGKIYTFVSTDPTILFGEAVVVEAEGGNCVAFVASPPKEFGENSPKELRRVIRRATPEDLDLHLKRRERAVDIGDICREKIREHNLDMKLIDTEIIDGGAKAVFTFFAEQRVDFRALVKDLAGLLKMRIEMRQVGARDESKMVGSLGPCGLETCCSSHLRSFKSISISMAKQQGLTPNPAKLTGKCGKLKCCLDYEHLAYQELRKGLPKLGTSVECEKGCGKIIDLNILKRECGILLYGGGMVRCPCANAKPLSKDEREAALAKSRETLEKEREDAAKRSYHDVA